MEKSAGHASGVMLTLLYKWYITINIIQNSLISGHVFSTLIACIYSVDKHTNAFLSTILALSIVPKFDILFYHWFVYHTYMIFPSCDSCGTMLYFELIL